MISSKSGDSDVLHAVGIFRQSKCPIISHDRDDFKVRARYCRAGLRHQSFAHYVPRAFGVAYII